MVHLLHPEYSDSSLLLKAIFETAIDGIITIDEEGMMQMVNPAAARLFQYQTEELLGNNISLLMPEPHRSNHAGYIMDYLTTGKARIIGTGRRLEAQKKDGTLFPISLSINEIKLDDKRIFTGIIHDLTKQKLVEDALKEEKEKAQMYFDLANTINVVLDKKGRVMQLNKLGCEFIGVEESDIIGKNWFEVVCPEHERGMAKKAFSFAMNDHTTSNTYFENLEIDRNGRPRLFAWLSTYIKGGDGYPVALMSSGIDITEKKEAEEHIRKLNIDLEKRVKERTKELDLAVDQLTKTNQQMEREIKEREKVEAILRENEIEIRSALQKEKELSGLKSRFISMASHEFRTPLSTILSSTAIIEMYQKNGAIDKQKKHIDRIRSTIGHLTNILNDFLSLSRLEEGKIQQNPQVINLTDFCVEVTDEMQGLLKPGQQIIHAGASSGSKIFLDKQMLKHILFNLISNSIKYSLPNKNIYCNCQLKENQLQIEIKDEGMGIPKEDQIYLFTRFFRAHNVGNIQGTGLGLNIVKRYVDILNGEIEFSSIMNKGSIFTITIPLKNIGNETNISD